MVISVKSEEKSAVRKRQLTYKSLLIENTECLVFS